MSTLDPLPLFASPDRQDVADLKQKLVAIAAELGLRAGSSGATVSDVRITAENRGLLTGHESGALMKRLGMNGIMREAGLYPTGNYRRSSVPRAKGNLNETWVVREHAKDVA